MEDPQRRRQQCRDDDTFIASPGAPCPKTPSYSVNPRFAKLLTNDAIKKNVAARGAFPPQPLSATPSSQTGGTSSAATHGKWCSTRKATTPRARVSSPCGESQCSSKTGIKESARGKGLRETRSREESENHLFPDLQKNYDDFARSPGRGVPQTRGSTKHCSLKKSSLKQSAADGFSKRFPVSGAPSTSSKVKDPDISTRDAISNFYNRESRLVPGTQWEHDTTLPWHQYCSESVVDKMAFEFDLVHRLARGRRFTTTSRWSIEQQPTKDIKPVSQAKAKSTTSRLLSAGRLEIEKSSCCEPKDICASSFIQHSSACGARHQKVRAPAKETPGERDYNISAARHTRPWCAKKKQQKLSTKGDTKISSSFGAARPSKKSERHLLAATPAIDKDENEYPLDDYKCRLLLDEVAEWCKKQMHSDRPLIAVGTTRALQGYIGMERTIRPSRKCFFAGDTSVPGNKAFMERVLNTLMFRNHRRYDPVDKTPPQLFWRRADNLAEGGRKPEEKAPRGREKRCTVEKESFSGAKPGHPKKDRWKLLSDMLSPEDEKPQSASKRPVMTSLDTESPSHSMQYFKNLDSSSVLASKSFMEILEMTTQKLPHQLEEQIDAIKRETRAKIGNWMEGFQVARWKGRGKDWRRCSDQGGRLLYMNRLHQKSKSSGFKALRVVGGAMVTKRHTTARYLHRPNSGKALFKLIAKSIVVRNKSKSPSAIALLGWHSVE